MNLSSADLCKLSVQEVADMLVDHDASGVMCQGVVNGRVYNLFIKLEVFKDVEDA